MPHVIRQHYLHIEVKGTEAEGLALQQRISHLCQDRLYPALECVFDACISQGQHIYIERIDLDLGNFSLAALEHKLPPAVAEALEKLLRERIAVIPPQTAQHSLHHAFIFFLKNGSLPWSFHLPENSSLEQMLLASWKEGTDNTELRQTLADSQARRRLVRQFSPTLLRQILLALLSSERTEQQEAAHPAAAVFQEQLQQVSSALWEQTFAHVVAQDYRNLAEGIRAILPNAPLAPATEALAEHFQEIPTNTEKFAAAKAEMTRKREEFSAAQQEEPRPATDISHDSAGYLQQDEEAPTNTEKFAAAKAEMTRKREEFSAAQQEEPRPAADISHDSAGYLQQDEEAPTNTEKFAAAKAEMTRKREEFSADIAPSQQRTAQEEEQNNKKEPAPARDSRTATEAAQNKKTAASPVSARPLHRADQRFSPASFPQQEHSEAAEGIYINNAGLVLLHPFLPKFFENLSLTAGKKLQQVERALCLLHFLATGQDTAPEYELVLPKILCNVPLLFPVETHTALSAAEKEEALALLSAVIRHWNALRNTSPDGLRGTFFVRAGKISLRENDWLLQVEPQTWDILLEQLPWGIGMIKLPWMDRLLHVEWI
jgi:hypothetical protein